MSETFKVWYLFFLVFSFVLLLTNPPHPDASVLSSATIGAKLLQQVTNMVCVSARCKEATACPQIRPPCATDRQGTTDRVTLAKRMTLPLRRPLLSATTLLSVPCPGTSSMHAGCHSRRMTSCSSTKPFPLLTLNCCTPPPPHTSSWPAGPYCLLAWDSRSHEHSFMQVQTFMPFSFFVWFTLSRKLWSPSQSSNEATPGAKWVPRPDWINTVVVNVT